MAEDSNNILDDITQREYKWGFISDIDEEFAPVGLTEDTVRFISDKKEEPEWMLDLRLKAFRNWLTMKEPKWARIHYPAIDYQSITYYAAPRAKKLGESNTEIDPELKRTFDKLGISLEEQLRLSGVAVDAVLFYLSSVSLMFERAKACLENQLSALSLNCAFLQFQNLQHHATG